MSTDSDLREIKNELRNLNKEIEDLTGRYGLLGKLEKTMETNTKDIQYIKEQVKELTSTDLLDIFKGTIFLTMAKRIQNIEEIITKLSEK